MQLPMNRLGSKRRILLLFVSLVLFEASAAQIASLSPADVMRRLRLRDDNLSAYSFKGSVRLSVLSPGEDPKVAESSATPVTRKELEPHWQTWSHRLESVTQGERWTCHTLGEDPISYGNDPERPVISPGIVSFKKPDSAPVAANLSVVAGAHPVLGLGLSAIMDPVVRQTRDGIEISGRIPGRGKVVAHFADRFGAQLKTLEFATGPQIKVDYAYGPYAPRGGPPVPTRVTSSVSIHGRVVSRAEYTVDEVKANVKKLPAAENWFKPGFRFVDGRVEPAVTFSYPELLKLNGGSTDLDADRLLQLSLAKQKAAPAPRLNQPARPPLNPIIVIGGCIAVVGALALALRKRRGLHLDK